MGKETVWKEIMGKSEIEEGEGIGEEGRERRVWERGEEGEKEGGDREGWGREEDAWAGERKAGENCVLHYII